MSSRRLLPILFAVIALFSCGAKDDRWLADTYSQRVATDDVLGEL